MKNTSPILINYHWSVYNTKSTSKILLQDEQTHYRIEPSQGKINGENAEQFKIFFSPEHASPYYEFCDFVVEGLPIDSMRNPPEALKVFSNSNKTEDVRITMPTYIGSNTPYLSIPYMQYNLRGQGNFRKMYLDPPILDYKEPLLINKPYTTSIIMRKEKRKDSKNLSEGQSTLYKKKIWVESVSDGTFEVIIDTKRFDESTSSEDDIDISVTIQSTTTGVKTAYLRVDIEDGAPLSYFIQAEFEGPLISIVEPCVEFGLQKVNTQVSFTMNVQNHSSVEAPIFIKNGNNFQDFTYTQY